MPYDASPLHVISGNRFRRTATPGSHGIRLYSNLPEIALGWITLISFEESNPKAGKHGAVTDAVLGTMVGMVVLVPDVMDGGGGAYPQSPDAAGFGILLGLRGGAQRQPYLKFQFSRSSICRNRFATR